MILYRLREYGSSDWTELCIEGDFEEDIAEALVAAIVPAEHFHVQVREDGEWEDVVEEEE